MPWDLFEGGVPISNSNKKWGAHLSNSDDHVLDDCVS